VTVPRDKLKPNLGDIAAKERAAKLVGTTISGRYKLVELLAMGGVGAVYLGEHLRMHKHVAIKVLHPDAQTLPDIAARFEREAVAGSHIQHPNVASATDFGELDDGSYFLVLEYVRGQTLRDLMKRGPLPVGRALGIARQIAAALAATHAKGIVHRDVKPRNVMLTEGTNDAVKLIDFGLAKLSVKQVSEVAAARASMSEHQITGIGAVFGTIAYLAPEAALHGMDTVDARADLYAVGVVLYEMLTGKHPFDTTDPVELFKRHARTPPPPFATRAPAVSVPATVEAVVMKLLAKSRDDRYPSAEALIEGLDAAWDGSVSPLPAPVSVAPGIFPGPSIQPPNSVPPEPRETPAPLPVLLGLQPPAKDAREVEAQSVSVPTLGSVVSLAAAPPPAPSEPKREAALPPPPPFAAAAARPPSPRWPFAAIAAGLAIGAGAMLWPTRDHDGAASGPKPPPSSVGREPVPTAQPSASAPTASAPPAPSAAPSASASAPPAAPAMDAAVARATLRRAVAARDRGRAMDAFFALAAQDPSAFRDPALAAAARDLASAAALTDGEDADRYFTTLGKKLGPEGLDILYDVVRLRGGSKAAMSAETQLRAPGALDEASPALRALWALREAPCADKAAHLDRAVADGDARALMVMQTTVTSCLGPQSEPLKAAIKALKAKGR
jgi:serine/threonine-protein kinase